jgi:hypothetical protein
METQTRNKKNKTTCIQVKRQDKVATYLYHIYWKQKIYKYLRIFRTQKETTGWKFLSKKKSDRMWKLQIYISRPLSTRFNNGLYSHGHHHQLRNLNIFLENTHTAAVLFIFMAVDAFQMNHFRLAILYI